MLRLVISCICLALAAAQTPGPFPVAGGFPGQFGAHPFFPGYGPQPHAFPVQPNPSPAPVPKPIVAPKPIAPAPQFPKGHIDILSQQNFPYHPHHQPGQFIPILRQNSNQQPGAGYQWDFASANGISAYENAEIIPINEEQATKNVQGGYQYTSPEGIPVEVTYTAGDFGFVPNVRVHIGHAGEYKH
ncbi:hypothetical protein PPYR_08386 [Photinus pyralis]|uniref:Uncharacterized protein n=2 Tax=Photinus pyralis TaxID=7054 RepID=A0A5N4AJ67_PHOPY|nr:endocuticle structural glycoprotein SgAbd-1-like [Photinus pyralis]KAB0797392.1 hypothetical protein PPYR_08386 [Photinus pyralis]